MKFNRRRSTEQTHFMLAAVMHGVLIGAAGVLLFFFILNTVENRNQQSDQTLPVSTTNNTKEKSNAKKFYAVQYGVYSSSQAAKDFLAGHPELENMAVIPDGKQFYLWSAVENSEKKIKAIVTKDSFVKPFTLSGDACEEKGLKILPQLLEASKVSKLNVSDSKTGQTTPIDWKKNVSVMTKVSDQLEVIKLQLLAKYASENDCIEIKF